MPTHIARKEGGRKKAEEKKRRKWWGRREGERWKELRRRRDLVLTEMQCLTPTSVVPCVIE